MFVILMTKKCPYGNLARSLLEQHSIKYESFLVSDSQKDYCKQKNNMDTFPQILYGTSNNQRSQVLIGGYDELKKLIDGIICFKKIGLSQYAIQYLIDNIKTTKTIF